MTTERHKRTFSLVFFSALLAGRVDVPVAGDGEVLSHAKISSTQGGFTGSLDDHDVFGVSATSPGDLDGDGIPDLIVGASQDDDSGADRGAVWVLFLRNDGTVRAHQKISDIQGNFLGRLDNYDRFGIGVASLGDIDGDGVGDIAVGAHGDDDGGSGKGAIWILFLNGDGTVRTHQKISDTQGNFGGVLSGTVLFGSAVAYLGDLDGDAIGDVAVGAPWDNEGGPQTGAIWILLLNSDGTVKSQQKVSDFQGGFAGELDSADLFGRSMACLGDIDDDGATELAVGALLDDDGGIDHGAVWILSLNSNGTVRSHQKISSTEGGFNGQLDLRDQFGISLAALGDLNCDGTTDLAVGANTDDDGGLDRGAVWVLFLNPDGTVSFHEKISDTVGNFTGDLDDLDVFGISAASPGDINGDHIVDLAVGATEDDDGGSARGAVWTLFLDGCASAPTGIASPVPRIVLGQNRPNPFWRRTRIGFSLARSAHTSLAIYDVSGARVRQLIHRHLPAGSHVSDWDGRNDAGERVATGVYFYRLNSGGVRLIRKSVLVK